MEDFGKPKIFHRVYKAKYFANVPFLEAKLGKQPSYAWRSILAAKEIIVRGSQWNVGNGQRVHILVDRWVPRPNSFSVISPRTP